MSALLLGALHFRDLLLRNFMTNPTEHKTVHGRILKYAQEIGWTYVARDEAEKRRGFDLTGASPEDRSRSGSLYFDDLLFTKAKEFNPAYLEAEGALPG